MEAKTVRKGEILAKKGTSADVLWYIADGTVHMKVGKAAVPLTKGDLIGLADIQSGIHSCDYVAATDIQVSVFATRENLHKTDFLSSRPDNCRAIALSINGVVCNLFKSLGELNSSLFKMLRITHKAYETYCNYAAFLHTTPQEIEEMEFLPKEEASDIRQSAVSRMHAGMHALLSGKESGQNLVEYHVVPGYILHCSSDIMDLCPQVEAASDMISQCLDICMNESGDDIYDRLLRLYMRATSDHQLADPIKTLLDEIYEVVFEIDPRIAEIRNAVTPPTACVLMWETRPVRSLGLSGTWEASAVVSIVAVSRFVRGSTLDRSACGMTTLRRIIGKVIPRDRAASICPGAIVLIPAIRYSLQNAEGIKDAARVTQVKYDSSTFR